jgi:hypothetical protein
MGACGGKTCQSLILKLYRDEGVDLCDVVPFSQRPLVAEVDLGMLAGEPAGEAASGHVGKPRGDGKAGE